MTADRALVDLIADARGARKIGRPHKRDVELADALAPHVVSRADYNDLVMHWAAAETRAIKAEQPAPKSGRELAASLEDDYETALAKRMAELEGQLKCVTGEWPDCASPYGFPCGPQAPCNIRGRVAELEAALGEVLALMTASTVSTSTYSAHAFAEVVDRARSVLASRSAGTETDE